MKKLYYLIILTVILGLVLTGCFLSNVGQVPSTNQKYNENNPNPYTFTFQVGDLVAGQTEIVGGVEVWNDAENLYVKYVIDDTDWCLTETHLHVATELTDIPQTNKFNPIPGQFEKNGEPDCLFEALYTYNLEGRGWDVHDEELFIAAHAVVFNETATKLGENLVANGSFEEPVTSGNWDVFVSSTPGLEWTVEPADGTWDGIAGLELQRLVYDWEPHGGAQYAELDAHEPVIIYQGLLTQTKDSYTLTYAWSPRPGVVENIMEVWWNGTLIATHSADGSRNDDTAWTVETHTGLVPNASGPTRLEFVDIEEEIPHGSGMFLDSVSVFQEEIETAWGYGTRFVDKGNWGMYFEYVTVEPYSFTDTQPVSDGTVGFLVTTVAEDGDWMVWTFDFPVEEFDGEGNLALGLIIATDGEGQGPAFQIHNNDGTDSSYPWGTWLMSPWGPTINDGWFGWHSGNINTPVTSLSWVEAIGQRNTPWEGIVSGDGVMEIRIKKSKLGNAFHWAASPTVGTGFWGLAYDVTMQIPIDFNWGVPVVDMNIPNYIAR